MSKRQRKKSRRPQPDPLRSDPFGLTNLLTIRAAGPESPDSFRIVGTSEGFELLADQDAGGGKKLKRFAMTAYTGGAMNVGFGAPVVVDLEGMTVLRQSNPILKQHDAEQIVGHTDKVEVSAQRLKVAGVMSGVGEAAQEVAALAANGFPWQCSIGCSVQAREYVEPGQSVTVNGRRFEGPVIVARKTVLGEVSFVPIGADQNTSAVVAAQQKENAMNFETWLKARGFDPAKLTDTERTLLRAAFDAEQRLTPTPPVTPPASPPNSPPVLTAAGGGGIPTPPNLDLAAEMRRQIEAAQQQAREAAAAEVTRQTEIAARCRRHGVTEVDLEITANGQTTTQRVNLEAHAIRANWTPDQAELHALRAARPTVPGGLVYATNRPDLNEAVLEAAVLQASRHQFRLDDDSFYLDATPDGKGNIRRVPEHMQREAQRDLKARYTDQVQQAAHTHFRGRIGAQELFQVAFRANGSHSQLTLKSDQAVKSMLEEWDGMEKANRIRATGSSTISISNVLANVLNKFSLQGYLFVEQAWRAFSAIRSVNDFKPTKSINLLGDVIYKQFGPMGELEHATLSDQAFANQAAPYGRIITIPWTYIVNDDLSMLSGVPMKIGQGAGLALNDAFWTVVKNMVAGTVNGDDGAAFFNAVGASNAFHTTSAPANQTAGYANKMSGGSSALSASSLKTAKALFDNQIDPNGNPLGFDAGTPVLLFGPSNWQAAVGLMQAPAIVYGGATAALQPNVNVWAGKFNPVMSRYVENANYLNTTTGWGIFFNPIALAAIEVAFLNGVDTPTVLQAGPDYQFDRLGISIRGTMPFGVNQQNFRAAVWSLGV